MKITITANDESPAVLCDHGREGPDSFTVTVTRSIEVIEYVQSDHAGLSDNGNEYVQISFNVTRSHADYTTAQVFVLTLGNRYPRSGEVRIICEDRATPLVLRDAKLKVSALPIIGVKTTVNYIIMAPKIEEMVQVLSQGGGQILTSEGHAVFVNKE